MELDPRNTIINQGYTETYYNMWDIEINNSIA